MLLIPSRQSRRRQRNPRRPAYGPIIASATYNSGGQQLVFEFDRAVDLTSFDGTRITVADGATTHNLLRGTETEILTPVSFRLGLEVVESTAATEVLLTILPGSGIIAADNRAELAGHDNLQLPYP